MSEMVGRVAQVIRNHDTSDNLDCEAIARAAIEAMRLPTEAMTAAGDELIFGPMPGFSLHPEERADVWRAMIDEALK